MIFGDPLKFAVEFTVDQTRFPGSHGRFCYKINGQLVGDYNMPVLLGDLLHPLAMIVKDNGKRQGESMCSDLGDGLFRALHSSMYGNDSPAEESHCEAIYPHQRAKFRFVPDAQPFDEWNGYLVQCESVDTLAFWHLGDEHIRYFTLETGEVDHVLSDAFHNLSRALSGD